MNQVQNRNTIDLHKRKEKYYGSQWMHFFLQNNVFYVKVKYESDL